MLFGTPPPVDYARVVGHLFDNLHRLAVDLSEAGIILCFNSTRNLVDAHNNFFDTVPRRLLWPSEVRVHRFVARNRQQAV